MRIPQRIVERWYPAVLALAAAIIYYRIPALSGYVLPDTIPSLLSAIITVAGVAIGFLITAKSILISIDDRPIVERLKAAGIYKDVITYIRSAIRWSFLLTILSCIALLFRYGTETEWDRNHAIGTAIWIWSAVGALLSYLRISRIWYTILSVIDTRHPG